MQSSWLDVEGRGDLITADPGHWGLAAWEAGRMPPEASLGCREGACVTGQMWEFWGKGTVGVGVELGGEAEQ